MTQKYDVIVIGGGVAGLTTAALLGKRGMDVLVLEARQHLGGLTTTEDVVPGVPCDTVDHELGWVPPALVADLALDRHGLQLMHCDPCATALTPGVPGESITLYPDAQRTAGSLARFSANDAAAWPAFAQRVAMLSGFLCALYEVPAPSLFASGAGNLVSMLALGRKARALGRSGIFDMLRTLPMSIADVLDESFANTALKGLLAARAVSRILQGPRSGATAFLFLHYHVGLPSGAVRGMLTARGGVGALAGAMIGAGKAYGVTFRTGATVARIDVNNERILGVTLESGEEIAADRVVSSVDARHTVYDLIDPVHVEPELSRAIGHVRMRGAAAKVNFVLDGPVPLPNAEALRGPLVVAPSMATLERAFDSAKHGAMSDDPTLEVRVPNALDPSLESKGNRVAMSVLAQWAPYSLKEGWDATSRSALGDRVVATLESVIPGITNPIVHRNVLSPRDIEERFGASEGSLTHGELALDQILFMRPVPALSRYRANNIEGLFVCGRGCHPGMPVPAAMLAAREIARAARGREPAPAPPSAPQAA
ncbi:MAG: phytoene desaturase family protein [Gemmatimonadaceae bacterium]